jgi:hypothetical protein
VLFAGKMQGHIANTARRLASREMLAFCTVVACAEGGMVEQSLFMVSMVATFMIVARTFAKCFKGGDGKS